jgi:nitroreductase
MSGTTRSDGERLLELIGSRHSVRRFSSTPITAETEQRLLAAACAAPSAGNGQPWFFVRVRSAELRARLCVAALSQRLVVEAPLCVVVCADERRALQAYGERGVSLYCLQDTAAATENLLLAAHALGLGACWVGAFRERDVAALLELPEHLRPVAIVPIGVPDEEPSSPGRRPLDEVSRTVP